MSLRVTCFVLVMSLHFVTSDTLCATSKQASRHVREGIAHFRGGNYDEAGRSFAEADVALPDDKRIAFDRGCAYAAQGETEKAIKSFHSAALTRDTHLAASSHYNLGNIKAASARAVFGDQPIEASPRSRQKGMELLAAAVVHYRDCLRLNDNHQDARHNLELIRQWMKLMRDAWARRDREKQREEMDLPQFVEMIERMQSKLRDDSRALAKRVDSPQRRHGLSQLASSQRILAEEIEPLKEKLGRAVESPAANPSMNASPPAKNGQLQQAITALIERADDAGEAMVESANHLGSFSVRPAVQSQENSLEALGEIYEVVAPFTDLLQRATAIQDGLTATTRSAAPASDAQIPDSDPDGLDDDTAGVSRELDFDELAREQSRVQRWSQVLPLKAEQLLKQPVPETPGAVNEDPKGARSDNADAVEQQEQHWEALRDSAEKAIELAPRIQEHTRQATEHLTDQHPTAALPDQEEALELLREIAKSLPNEQQQQQQDQNQGQENQQNPSDDPSRQQQQSPDERQQDRQSQEQGEQGQQRNPDPSQRQLTRQQAEAILSKVRERQQEHRERQKQIRARLRGPVEVDRDW